MVWLQKCSDMILCIFDIILFVPYAMVRYFVLRLQVIEVPLVIWEKKKKRTFTWIFEHWFFFFWGGGGGGGGPCLVSLVVQINVVYRMLFI